VDEDLVAALHARLGSPAQVHSQFSPRAGLRWLEISDEQRHALAEHPARRGRGGVEHVLAASHLDFAHPSCGVPSVQSDLQRHEPGDPRPDLEHRLVAHHRPRVERARLAPTG